MTTIKTIVFGPSGNVGSAAARRAQSDGAKVFLAMRNPQKRIPGLSVEEETQRGFERVQADLAKPDTIVSAVTQTGAKHAFIYLLFGMPDNMRSTIMALKSAGIEFVVFLSSDSIRGDIRSIPPGDFIPWSHAQVEISLEEIFGQNGFVAVRPGYFASNALWWNRMISEREVKVAYPDAKFDWISPEDIGRVCGTFLARGFQALDGTTTSNIIRLNGPEPVSQRDAVRIIARATGQNIQITPLDEQEGLKMFVDVYGMSESVAKRMIDVLRTRTDGPGSGKFYEGPAYEKAVDNVRKYAAKEPMILHEWVDENKHRFGT